MKLAVKNVSKRFGGVLAVNDVSLQVPSGERHAIIGPNGAGKSTLFNLITGELPLSAGAIVLDEQDVSHWPIHRRANGGIGHTFQRNNLFMGLTVGQTVRLAVQHQLGLERHWFRAVAAFAEIQETAETVLHTVGLLAQKDEPVQALSYGQQRVLEIALALATAPTLLLLDEPTAGMSPAETAAVTQLIQALPTALTILIVEHDMDVVFRVANRVTVLHYGQVISQGTAAEVRADTRVTDIYLGNIL